MPRGSGRSRSRRARAERTAPSGRALALSFVAVAVAFLISTAVAEYGEREIRHAAAEITGDTAPSVERLGELRSGLRRFTLVADHEVDRGFGGGARHMSAELRQLRARMHETWIAYQALPAFPDERALWPAAAAAAAEIERAMAELETAMERGAWPKARATLEQVLEPATDDLDATMMRLTALNAARGAELARRIDVLGSRSVVLAVSMDAISVLLTLVAGSLLARVVRRYTSLVERRAAELELFAGRVAHDVLGPLGAASLALDMAEREALPGGRSQRVIASGKAGLARARSIADGLLEFARAGAQPQPDAHTDVLEVIRAVVDEVEPAARARDITLFVEAVQPGEVACGAGILTSVVSNLVRNAVKYVGDGPRRRVTVRARPGAGRVRVEVEDNGHGLPPELGEQVWQPYVRGASHGQPGIGLGLATVKKIVEAHGGRVDMRSVPGLGCRFGIELPAWHQRPPARTASRGGRKDNETVDRPAHAQ